MDVIQSEHAEYVDESQQKEGRGLFFVAMLIYFSYNLLQSISSLFTMGLLDLALKGLAIGNLFPLHVVIFNISSAFVGAAILFSVIHWKKAAAKFLITYIAVIPILGIVLSLFIIPQAMLAIWSWQLILLPAYIVVPHVINLVLWSWALKRKWHLFK